MPVHITRFAQAPFTPGGHPLESKQVGPDPKVVRVRFDVGFEDPAWCTRDHVILVEEGALTLELERETVKVDAGEVIRLAGAVRHRASNQGSVPTTLLIISDLFDTPDPAHAH